MAVGKKTPRFLTPNQVIALSIERERERRCWTQEYTVAQLGQSGLRWSRVNYAMSISTSPKKGRQPREFNGDELTALAQTFAVPVWRFFIPPADRLVKLPGGGPTLDAAAMRFIATGRK
jgi:hypothetical protein